MILGEQAGKINAAYGRIQPDGARNGDLTFWEVHAKESESLAELGERYRDLGEEERMEIEVALEGQVLHPIGGEKECVKCQEVFVGVEFGSAGAMAAFVEHVAVGGSLLDAREPAVGRAISSPD